MNLLADLRPTARQSSGEALSGQLLAGLTLALLLSLSADCVAQPAAAPSRRTRFVPIDAPRFVSSDELIEPLRSDEIVLGLDFMGTQRAYPVRYMQFHHICHDEVGNKPVVVTYCALCRSGIAFEGEVEKDGKPLALTFEVAGLVHGYLAIIDRETGSQWPHITGTCIAGPLKGTRLTSIPLTTTTWAQWLDLHPGTQVLAPLDRFRRSKRYFLLPLEGGISGSRYVTGVDQRLPANSTGLGVRAEDEQIFFPYNVLERAGGLASEELDGKPIVVFYDAHHRAARCFQRRSHGMTLSFQQKPGDPGVFMTADGSEFDLLGRCQTGPLKGLTLQPVRESLTVRWYGWSLTFPKTRVFDALSLSEGSEN